MKNLVTITKETINSERFEKEMMKEINDAFWGEAEKALDKRITNAK